MNFSSAGERTLVVEMMEEIREQNYAVSAPRFMENASPESSV
jgi:hypothetical protein